MIKNMDGAGKKLKTRSKPTRLVVAIGGADFCDITYDTIFDGTFGLLKVVERRRSTIDLLGFGTGKNEMGRQVA